MSANYQFDGDQIDWTEIDDPSQDYPCKYWMSILGADPKTGRLDLIVKWPPNSYCHFHRHVADTAILVLEGEQHVTEIHDDGSEGEHKVHWQCLQPWLKSAHTCPTCRFALPTSEAEAAQAEHQQSLQMANEAIAELRRDAAQSAAHPQDAAQTSSAPQAPGAFADPHGASTPPP